MSNTPNPTDPFDSIDVLEHRIWRLEDGTHPPFYTPMNPWPNKEGETWEMLLPVSIMHRALIGWLQQHQKLGMELAGGEGSSVGWYLKKMLDQLEKK